MFRPDIPARSSSRSPAPAGNHENYHGSTYNAQAGNMVPNSNNPFQSSQLPSTTPSPWDQPADAHPSTSSVMDAQKAAATEKTRQELGKLLSVALQRLRERERPPSVFEAISSSFPNAEASGYGLKLSATANTVRGAVRLASYSGHEWQRGQDPRSSDAGTHTDDEDEEGSAISGQGSGQVVYSTEQTFQHLTVVRDTLIIQGSTIFSPSPGPALSRQKGSWVGRSISRNRDVSTTGEDEEESARDRLKYVASIATTNESLLDDLITILAEIIKEDCRYKVTRFRLLCPPNALQGVVLEVASILARLQRNNPGNLTRIGFAMLPAFSTFPPSLHERIMRFFEQLLKGMLATFSRERLAGFEGFIPGTINELGRQNLGGSVPEIQVEWAAEENHEEPEGMPLFRPWITSKTGSVGVSAWTTPRQPMDSYYPGSLISPLLACMSRIISIHSHDHATLYRFHETIATIIHLKEDAYADIVDVVAFESSKSRRAAIEVLATFWPRAFGHLTLSSPLEIMSYEDSVRRMGYANSQSHLRHNPTQFRGASPARDIHEFLIWRFQAAAATSGSFRANNRPPNRFSASCAVCTKPIVGMGLFCPCCMLTVHPGACYDHDGVVDRLKYTSRDGQQEKISTIRYSRCLPQRRPEKQSESRKDRHHFEPIHLFSLVLCFLCRKPSWGCYNQGLRCSSCLHFAHSACVEKATASRDIPACRSTPFSYKSVTIQWEVLRKSWVEFYSAMIWKEDELFQKSHDEVSVAYGIFWTELELLQAGTASSSIVVEQSAPRSQPSARPNGQTYDTFELHYLVALYFAQLSGSRLPKSRNSLEYVENCGNVGAEISVIHNLPLLLLAASVIKLPRMGQSGNGDMLQVGPDEERPSEELPHPFEIVSLAHIRDVLGYEAGLYSDATARFTMSQIHRLGILTRVDCSPDLFNGSDLSPVNIMCTFPSTLAIDASTSVEALFTSIQACLEDLDVSVNEFGFLLLVRRCWPSALMTDYALSRLASLVLTWILTEDDRLLQIVRDFVAVGEPLPGVRARIQQATWPPLTMNGETTGGSSGSGAADYTFTRRAIIERYGNPWLHHFHDLNRTLYAECLYQQCIQLSEASSLSTSGFFPQPGKAEEERRRRDVQLADDTLKYVVKLCQLGIVWTTFDDLFINWLDTMSRLSQFATPVIFKNLPKLFSADDYSVNRLSVADEATNPDISQYMADPWRVIVDAASEDTAGLERCLQWVLVLARSGVEIPNSTLMQLSAFARDFDAPFITHSILAEVLLYSVWVKSFGRSELLSLISSLYARHSSWLQHSMANKDHYDLIHSFLRHTLAACLLLYGCKRETVRSLRFLDPSQLITLPPRRKSNVPTESSSTDPLSIDMDMLDLLSTAAIEGTAETCTIVAKFLCTLVSEETGYLLKADDVDQFVLLNGHVLCKCAWHFYSQTQIPELNVLRIGFLLRLLIVDTKPFENLLEEILHKDSSWESRFEGITRIFRIILDLSTPGLEIVGRQWRPDVVFISICFFSQSWIDDRAEVRLACEILIGTLLPTHMETMTLCFEEYLTRATIPEKTSLAMFLTLLHPVLPSWRLISWKTLVQALGMNDDRRKQEGILVIDQDLEMATLQATLINLALQLVADGVMADLVSLLQIKLCMVQLFGFQRCQMTSGRGTFRVVFDGLGQLSSSPVVQSCFQGLMRALDTSLPCDLPPACMVESNDDTVTQGLLGSVFVDVVIKTINQIDFLQTPYIVARCLLTSLVIILAKHDFTSSLLHDWIQPLFRAVHTVMQLLSQPSLSFDLKQMIFTAAGQAAKQIHIDRKTSTVILSEYVTVTTAVVAEYGASSDHMLALRGRQFFDEILTQFETQKVYWTLFKYPCSQDFFAVLAQVMRERIKSNPQAPFNQQGESMRDAVVREVLTSTHDRRQPAEVDTPLKNLATYVELVHHTGYSDSLIAYLGYTLTSMAAQITDWKSTAFDPNSLLRVCSLVAQHHKPQSKDLLLQGEKYLRVVLARFSVNQETIVQLLQVSTSSHRWLSKVPGGQIMPNYIALTLFETLSGMLRGRIRGQSTTLKYMLEIMCQSTIMKDGVFDTEQIMTVAADGIAYLHDRSQEGAYNDAEFEANESVAKLMMQTTNLDFRLLATIAVHESDASLRMWNFLLLAVLTMDWSECALSLWKMHSRCSQILQRIIIPQQTTLTESASMELNQALLALRLWLLLIQQICGKSALSTVVGHVADRDQCERVLWNELWPSFERLLLFSISVAGYEEHQTHVALVWQSFADILIFLHHSRSLIPLESSLVMHLVQLKGLPINENLSNKILKAIRTLAQPPVETPFSSTLLVVRNDFLAIEKLGWELRRRAEERGRDDRDIRKQFRQPTAGSG